MTYKELYESAIDKLEKSKITLCEFEKMIEPLNAEIATADSDTISRAKAIDALDEISCEVDDGYGFDYAKWREYFCELPSAQPKKGRWISADAMFHGVPFYCSECGENTRDTVMGKPRWNFCPNCGADMREVTT